jgi:hypothetical protein
MTNLPVTHPEVYQEMLEGGFVTRQSEGSTTATPLDMLIEETANKFTKLDGGVKHFISTNRGAVDRYMCARHRFADVARSCRQMAGIVWYRESKGLHS